MKKLFLKIKRVIEFLPIIWKGYDFDYEFALNLFTYQLQRTADLLSSRDDAFEDDKYTADRIRLVLRLLDYGYGNRGCAQLNEKYQFMYGKYEFLFSDSDKPTLFSGRWKYAINEQHSAEIDAAYQKDLYKMKLREDRAKRLAWQIINKDIEKWWL